MCSRFLSGALLAMISLTACKPPEPDRTPKGASALRVCSDPNNLPFSNERKEGFENHIADLIAREMDARVEYTWFAQRRGFIRNTLNERTCDVVMGVPHHYDPVETTRPYYRSTYVFVTRVKDGISVDSFDDARLRDTRIGVHIVGDDYSNPPPVHSLGRRGIVRNVRGYSIYGDYSQPNPPARLVEAVASNEIDMAILWGPFGGYFGAQQKLPLNVVPVRQKSDGPELPYEYAISLGVRKGELEFRDRLQSILDRRKAEIDQVLQDFRIPRIPEELP